MVRWVVPDFICFLFRFSLKSIVAHLAVLWYVRLPTQFVLSEISTLTVVAAKDIYSALSHLYFTFWFLLIYGTKFQVEIYLSHTYSHHWFRRFRSINDHLHMIINCDTISLCHAYLYFQYNISIFCLYDLCAFKFMTFTCSGVFFHCFRAALI